MCKHNLYYLIISAAILLTPISGLAEKADPLAEYQNMINQSLKQPLTNGTQKSAQSTASNPNITNGQSALRPVQPAPPILPPAQIAPPSTNTPAQYPDYSTSNAKNSNATQQNAPAGPPNIFVTPNSENATSNQGSPVIHY